MKELIEALQIMNKYYDGSGPTHCEHDILTICGVDPEKVSKVDIERLDDLGFFVGDEYGESAFHSFKFGSS